MTGPELGASGERARGDAPPPAQLVRLHRHSLTNVLVIGGTPTRREQAARAFHRESPLRAGAFVAVDCVQEEERLRVALRDWTGAAVADPGMNPYRAAEQGTLFLDFVERLSPDAQRMLLALARQLLGEGAGGDQPSAGRLVAGNPHPLSEAVARGRFLAPLYDALDKVRVELETPEAGSTS